MKCAYCGEEAKGTREHIISSGILDLFPECDLTFDEYRIVIHNADPVVNDVCAKCNNSKISYIDSYAKDFVAKYCLRCTSNSTRIGAKEINTPITCHNTSLLFVDIFRFAITNYLRNPSCRSAAYQCRIIPIRQLLYF